jgi:glycosyltransferase involved in cell wall biosynthesis
VLHVLPSDLDRGAQVYAGRLRDALTGDPQQRHLAVSLFKSPDAALRADERLRVPSGLLRRLGFDPRAVCRLRRLARRHRVDLLVAHGGEALKYVVPAAGSTPTVYYKVGLSSRDIARGSRKWLYRTLTARTTQVVGVSQAIVGQASDVLGVPPSKLTLIPNGRDPHTYHPSAMEPDPQSTPRVLFVGQLEVGKRPDLFLDVVEVLRSRGVAFDAAIVGDGPLRSAVTARAESLAVTLMGIRNDVPELLRGAAVLVMTSESGTEGMPGVLIEAGLSGVPVVSTFAAGVSDVVVDSQTGFVVQTNESADLAFAVERLLADGRLRAEFGVRARLRCEDLFTVEATAQQWHELAASLAHTRPDGDCLSSSTAVSAGKVPMVVE